MNNQDTDKYTVILDRCGELLRFVSDFAVGSNEAR